MKFFSAVSMLLLSCLLISEATAADSQSVLWRRGVSLIPYPQEVRVGGEDFVLSSGVKVILDQNADEGDRFTAVELTARLKSDWGIEAAVGGPEGAAGSIVLTRQGAPAKAGEQGYSLETSAKKITVRANAGAGLFYGMQTILQLIQPGRAGSMIQGVEIIDWPDIPERAVHYDTKHFQEKQDYVENFIRTLARYKINMLIWEWEDKFEYRSHPEIGAPGAFTMQQMQNFTSLARQYHIQIVPLVQGLGHVSFILKHPQNKHLREVPSDNWGFCPLREGTYEMEFDLIKEAIEATPGSEYFHIGCDETYVLGKGVECGCQAKLAEIGRYALKEIYINRIAEQVKKLGRKPMAWDGGYEPEEKVKPVEGLMTPGGYDSRKDALALEKGYPLYIYDPNPGIEHLFLPYFYRETIYDQYGGHLERSYRELAPAALSGKFKGMISTSWNCSGVHNQIWMLRYIIAAEYSWSGSNPGLEEFTDKFFVNYYGSQSRNVRELYEILNKASYYYMDSFERKVWHWGEVGKTHLPDLPRDDVEYDPYWNTQYRDRVSASREMVPSMRRALTICRINQAAGAKNAYDFELFTRLAELFDHTARTYLALSSLERAITEAHRTHFNDNTAAYRALERAAGIVESNLKERAEVFGRIKQTWEKSQLPKGMSTTEKKYVHGRDQQHNFANRRPDLTFMIYDEQKLGLEDYLVKLRAYMAWYKDKFLAGQNLAPAGPAQAGAENDDDDM